MKLKWTDSLDIAIELIKLSGLTPEVDIPIEYIGLRPGEKMFEELISSGENITDSPHEKIMVLKNEMNEGWNQTLAKAETVVNISKSYDSNSIRSFLAELVPEYRSVNTNENSFDFTKKKNQKI